MPFARSIRWPLQISFSLAACFVAALVLICGSCSSSGQPKEDVILKVNRDEKSAGGNANSGLLSAASLQIRPVREAEQFLKLSAAGTQQPPENLAFEFTGGTLLLHVVTFRDYPNTKGSSDFLPEYGEGELIREIQASFSLGPFPTTLDRPQGEKQRSQFEVARIGLLSLHDDFLRLAVEQTIARNPGGTSATLRGVRSTAYDVTPAAHVRDREPKEEPKAEPLPPLLQFPANKFLASDPYALKPYQPAGPASKTAAVIQLAKRVTSGDCQQIYWQHSFNGLQTVVLAQCLPFGAQPETESLERDIAALKLLLETSPADRQLQYYLAWGYFLLAHQQQLSGDDMRAKLSESVSLLRTLCQREPANVLFRNALRENLLLHLAFESRRESFDQSEEIVAEYLRLQPVFDECLNMAMQILKSSNLKAKQKVPLIYDLAAQGLARSSRSPSLARANAKQFRQIFTPSQLAGWGFTESDRKKLDELLAGYEK